MKINGCKLSCYVGLLSRMYTAIWHLLLKSHFPRHNTCLTQTVEQLWNWLYIAALFSKQMNTILIFISIFSLVGAWTKYYENKLKKKNDWNFYSFETITWTILIKPEKEPRIFVKCLHIVHVCSSELIISFKNKTAALHLILCNETSSFRR